MILLEEPRPRARSSEAGVSLVKEILQKGPRGLTDQELVAAALRPREGGVAEALTVAAMFSLAARGLQV